MTRKRKVIGGTALTFILFFANINFIHNYSISELSRSRNSTYSNWVQLLRNGNVLNGVLDGDSMISSTSNDAFEQNAGFIFNKTGIRLTYLFNSGILWPKIAECPITNCTLEPPSFAIDKTLISITRSLQDQSEWVNQSKKLRRSGKYKVWYSEYIYFGQDAFLFFIVPFSQPKNSLDVEFSKIKVYLISSKEVTTFPAIGNTCFNLGRKIYKTQKFIIYSYKSDQILKPIDMRALTAAGC